MQTVQIIQKPVVINANTYKMNFVRHTLPNGEVQDLEVIDFDESKPGVIEIALSDTEVPTLNFENLALVLANRKEVYERMEINYEYPAWYIWDTLTTIEKIQRVQPELEAYFNQVEA